MLTINNINNKTKWIVALSAVLIHLALGSVYTFSVLKLPIEKLVGWDSRQMSVAFSMAIFFLGCSSALLNKIVSKRTPKVIATYSAFLYGFGIIFSGIALKLNNLYLFYIGYGFIAGLGLGIGYITPITTLMKWFPKHKGFATGLVVMGFGFSSLLFAPISNILIDLFDVDNTLILLGFVYFAVIIVASHFLIAPQEDVEKINNVENQVLSNKNIFSSLNFYILCSLFFINITGGLSIIFMASPFIQKTLNVNATQASFIIGIMGLFNGFGRIFWSTLSDKIGRFKIIALFFISQAVLFYMLTFINTYLLFCVIIYFIISCYGGLFSIMPALISDIFDNKVVTKVYSYILIAQAISAVVGPKFISILLHKTSNYNVSLQIFSVSYIVALVLLMVLVINRNKKIYNN